MLSVKSSYDGFGKRGQTRKCNGYMRRTLRSATVTIKLRARSSAATEESARHPVDCLSRIQWGIRFARGAVFIITPRDEAVTKLEWILFLKPYEAVRIRLNGP